MSSLAESLEAPRNNILALRHVAAVMVMVMHSFALSGHIGEEPLWRLFPESNFGLLGVQIFFVMSGLLITRSWHHHPRLDEYVVARVLRIYPALVVATLFTIVLAGVSSPLPWRGFLGDPQTLVFLWHTATGWVVTDELPGAFAGNPFPRAANGSLWTLPMELRLYVVIGLAGAMGLVTRRHAWALTLIAVIALAALYPGALPIDLNAPNVRGLSLLFALGSLAYAFRTVISLSLIGAMACALLYVVNPLQAFRGAAALPLLTYIVLVLAFHPLLRAGADRPRKPLDLSYGLYVYAFPVQQTLMMNARWLGPWQLLGLALTVTAALAWLSWHFVEAPALRLKRRTVTTLDTPIAHTVAR